MQQRGTRDPYYKYVAEPIGAEVRATEVFKMADKVYPNVSIRLQPLPNKLEQLIYQLHIRDKRLSTRESLNWKMVCEGTLVEIMEFLRNAQKAT